MLAVGLVLSGGAAAVGCVELPPCRGCGCRGGTGYRGPDHRCVGFQDLARVCGIEPGRACRFENMPNTGLNEACARRPARGGRRTS